MKTHIVKIETKICHFRETENIFDIHPGGVQIYGQSENIIDFVNSIRLDQEWFPYGYILRWVYRQKDSKNMTAFLFKLGDKF